MSDIPTHSGIANDHLVNFPNRKEYDKYHDARDKIEQTRSIGIVLASRILKEFANLEYEDTADVDGGMEELRESTPEEIASRVDGVSKYMAKNLKSNI